jgi:phosphosulfolactate phosphohydrolase-like enzyme
VDTSALALTAEHQQVVEDAQLFGEKWAPKATEIDRLDAAPTDAMIKDTAGDILFATTCTGRSVLKNTIAAQLLGKPLKQRAYPTPTGIDGSSQR